MKQFQGVETWSGRPDLNRRQESRRAESRDILSRTAGEQRAVHTLVDLLEGRDGTLWAQLVCLIHPCRTISESDDRQIPARYGKRSGVADFTVPSYGQPATQE